MKFSVPILYKINGIRRGRARSGVTHVWETVDVEVTETSDAEAPVAVSWDDRLPMDYALVFGIERTSWSADGFAHTRLHEGSHWAALNAAQGCYSAVRAGGGQPPLTAELLARTMEDEGASLLFNSRTPTPGERAKHRKRGSSGPSEEYSMIRSTSRDGALQKLDRKVSDLLIVEGVVYLRCDEPTVTVSASTGLLRVRTDHAPNTLSRAVGHRFYTLLEAGEALAVARTFFNTTFGPRTPDPRNETRLPVVRHSLAHDPLQTLVRRTRIAAEYLEGFFYFLDDEENPEILRTNLGAVSRVLAALNRIPCEDNVFSDFELAANAIIDASPYSTHVLESELRPLLDMLADRPVEIGDVMDSRSPG